MLSHNNRGTHTHTHTETNTRGEVRERESESRKPFVIYLPHSFVRNTMGCQIVHAAYANKQREWQQCQQPSHRIIAGMLQNTQPNHPNQTDNDIYTYQHQQQQHATGMVREGRQSAGKYFTLSLHRFTRETTTSHIICIQTYIFV